MTSLFGGSETILKGDFGGSASASCPGCLEGTMFGRLSKQKILPTITGNTAMKMCLNQKFHNSACLQTRKRSGIVGKSLLNCTELGKLWALLQKANRKHPRYPLPPATRTRGFGMGCFLQEAKDGCSKQTESDHGRICGSVVIHAWKCPLITYWPGPRAFDTKHICVICVTKYTVSHSVVLTTLHSDCDYL